MKLNCLGTGSTGNSYIVTTASGCFLLDAGVPLKTITHNIDINNLDFAFISHLHKDHSKEMQNLANRGVLIIRGYIYNEFSKISLNERLDSKYDVLAFPVEHDNCPNGGCIIIDKSSQETILYITDFSICKYDLSAFKFNNIIIECNYVDDIIKNLITNDDNAAVKYRRQIKAHLGLNGLMLFLDKLDLSSCKQIDLIHLSQGCGDERIIQCTIYAKYRIKTGMCKQFGGIYYVG